MRTEFKRRSIILAGYAFQNLIGLETLCNWLDSPDLYRWVQFEADQDDYPLGLDDIVACRSDDSLVLLQVKFTVDADDTNNALSWDWLLAAKEGRRSLFQKWLTAFGSLAEEQVAEAALITNRVPDQAFASHLKGSKVDLKSVPQAIVSQLEQQAGSDVAVRSFFDGFVFRHSHQGYRQLQRTLVDRYVPVHTESHGWHALSAEVVNWAVLRNSPPPDGRITLEYLRGVLDRRRPQPLNQAFRVPEGYTPPDQDFGDGFLAKILSHDAKGVVLWGSPGQGKSTYLSYLCQEMERLGVPYIRHHYFLGLDDVSDRFSFQNVANSLMAQMEGRHGHHVHGLLDRPEKLGEWVANCAAGYAREGKRFAVLIDGLDHVWREQGSKQSLDTMFRQLVPVPSNAILVLGTQKVSEEQLPTLLTAHAFPWIELPRMSPAAVRRWLTIQHRAKRFHLPSRLNKTKTLSELSDRLHQVSAGHPLHLTYAFEGIVRHHRTLTLELIDSLPPCPSGDIVQYYGLLWNRLSYRARNALHLIAETGFIWPVLGLETCLGVPAGQLSQEIGHLLDITPAGWTPFHSSLLAFVRNKPAHQQQSTALLPAVVEWLESEAPPFYGWGWLWLVKARLGQTVDLVQSPNRAWAIESVAKAYPLDQILRILSTAEEIAFAADDFARALELRMLKNRLSNGPKYQIDEFDRVIACALRLTDDDYPLRTLSAGMFTASIGSLHLLALQYLAAGRNSDAIECLLKMRDRINNAIEARAFDRNSFRSAVESFLEIAAATKRYDRKHLLKTLKGTSEGPQFFRFFIRHLARHEDLSLLFEFTKGRLPTDMREDLANTIVRLGAWMGAQLNEWPEFGKLARTPLHACWSVLFDRTNYERPSLSWDVASVDISHYEEEAIIRGDHFLHSVFFQSLAASLEIGGVESAIALPSFERRKWLNSATSSIASMSKSVAGILSRGDRVPFDLPFRLADGIGVPKDHDSYRDYIAFRQALLKIATDLFLLASASPYAPTIPDSEWQAAVRSKHFAFSPWLHEYVLNGRKLISDFATASQVQSALKRLSVSVTQINERAQEYLELCELAILHNLNSLGHDLLSRTLQCVFGYGSHKDLTLSFSLDAVEAIAQADTSAALASISALCPIVARIDDITDGDETTHTKFDLARLLLQFMPNSFAAWYRYLLEHSEWSDADRVLNRMLRVIPLDSSLAQLVTAAACGSESIEPLRTRANNGDREAATLLLEHADLFGWPQDQFSVPRTYDSPPPEGEQSVEVLRFGPDELQALMAELEAKRVYTTRRTLLREWFDGCVTKSNGLDLLSSLEAFRDADDDTWGIGELFDPAFDLSLGLQGKRKAYRWLVAAQIQGGGWEPFLSTDTAALARFAKVHKYYPDDWKSFIHDTARSRHAWASERLLIPMHRLVQYLVAVGQIAQAVGVNNAIVKSIVEDVSEEPVTVPPWYSAA